MIDDLEKVISAEIEFIPVENNTLSNQSITKFGGQPFSFEEAEWPRSKISGNHL